MNLAELPNRRVEAWKYSDLRAAMTGLEGSIPARATPAASPIQTLAHGGDEDVLTITSRDQVHQVDHGVLGSRRTTSVVVPALQSGVLFERLLGHTRLTAGFADITLEEGAQLTRIVLQQDAQRAVDADQINGVTLNEARVRLAAGAGYRQIIVAEGAKLTRLETHVAVEGEGAEVELNGVYMAGRGRHADLTSVIEHKVGGGTTRQLIKGVAAERGRGVFQGKIVVAPRAQKTDARQYHHGILLEEGAEIFAKPELMIHADDVQCAHGNTAGGLDEGALFYMRSRGLPEADARAMLIEAFLVEAIPEDLDAAIREELTGRISAWLREARP